MRTVSVHEWFYACTHEERSAMEEWFEANGTEWSPGVFIIERRCGVTLLCMLDQPNRGGRHLGGDRWVIPKRPQSALSEQPFPWPEVAR